MKKVKKKPKKILVKHKIKEIETREYLVIE